jgi:hypothetical protein
LQDEENFIIALANNPFVFVDNLDKMFPWLEDILASVSTGSTLGRRELYTTFDERTIRPDTFIAITSRTPKFTRDDISDRGLINNVERFINYIDEEMLDDQMIKYYDHLWTYFLHDLNKIIRVMRSDNSNDFNTKHRMAGWSRQAQFIEKALNVSEIYDFDFSKFLDSINYERAYFQLYDSFIFEMLKNISHQLSDDWFTSNDIIKLMSEIDPELKLKPRTLTTFFKNERKPLKLIMGLESRRNSNLDVLEYYFKKLESGKGNPFKEEENEPIEKSRVENENNSIDLFSDNPTNSVYIAGEKNFSKNDDKIKVQKKSHNYLSGYRDSSRGDKSLRELLIEVLEKDAKIKSVKWEKYIGIFKEYNIKEIRETFKALEEKGIITKTSEDEYLYTN